MMPRLSHAAQRVLQPIETIYGGYHFRSLLEARWAVFFTRLGLDWEYEPQGFVVGRTFGRPRNYRPDFYLSKLGLYVEVKPAIADQVDPDGVRKWEDFAGEVAAEWDHDRAAMFCGPIPNPDTLDPFGPPRAEQWYEAGIYIPGEWHLAWCVCPSGQHFDIAHEARGGRIYCGCPRITDDRYHTGDDPRISDAYGAARAARFDGKRGL